MARFSDEDINELRQNYIILPRQLIHWWGGAVILVLAALGITSLVSFKEAVTGVAATVATGAAEKAATQKAVEVAALQAEGVVRSVFESSQKSASRVAAETARQAVKPLVQEEVSRAAQREVEIAINQKLSSDVITSISKVEKAAIESKERIVTRLLNKETLSAVALHVEKMSVGSLY
jgi:hypothetical protein